MTLARWPSCSLDELADILRGRARTAIAPGSKLTRKATVFDLTNQLLPMIRAVSLVRIEVLLVFMILLQLGKLDFLGV